jgi:hypothetical protein
MQISTVVITNIYVFRSCLDSSIDDVSKRAFMIAEVRKRFVVLVVILIIIVVLVMFDIFAELQQPSSFS